MYDTLHVAVHPTGPGTCRVTVAGDLDVVTDPNALEGAVIHGIGRGKPYGAGLLSLAPTSTA
ncbi:MULTISPECIES: type I-E CRISPR-associated protein Cas6/Cse3/CasE [Streptomyces]|uniref:type I-E CRISPR-associated protein Cas6/Cse3/CasE n=1 Tax=Streptomyces TaxID=1883 RepID=UPI0035F49A2F